MSAMVLLKKAFRYLIHDTNHFFDACVGRLNNTLPDKLYLSLRYRFKMGCWMNWNRPRTFSEKIQWLKVYASKPEYTNYIDKAAVKEIVARKIGWQYIIPTIGVWNCVDDIEWDCLPNQFVIKVTDDGGSNGIFICKDFSSFDKENVAKKLTSIMNRKKSKKDVHREHPYEKIHRRIIAEKYIEFENSSNNKDSSDLIDYKFFCFNGTPRFCQVIRNRNIKETIDFYDMEWNHMPFVGLNPVAKNGLNPVAKPKNLKEMISICEKLSEEFPFIRVDLYNVDGKIYFGELTFYPASGFGVFDPDEWNYKLGDMIKLPLNERG